MRSGRRWLRAAGLTVLVGLTLGSAPSALGDGAESLGSIPEQCTGANYEFPGCLVATRLGALTLSPHVVHAGATITGTIALTGPYRVSWPTAIPYLIQVGSCVETPTCSWKVPANAPTVQFTTLTVGVINNQGVGISRDYYGIIGKDKFELAGHIKDAEGKPVPGVKVRVTGTQSASAVTSAEGEYNLLLKRGTYTVTPQPAKGASIDPSQSTVALTQDRTVDFRVRPNVDEVTVTPEPDTLAASGTGVAGITITDRNSAGEPVEGAAINVVPPLEYSSPALICDSSGQLVYPTLLNDGSALGAHFVQSTDSAGEIHLTAFFGAVPGGWAIEAGESSAPLSRYGHAEVSLTPSSGAGELPDALTSLLVAAGNKTIANFTQEPQRRLLEWLGQVRGEIHGVAFLPIHSIDAAGFPESGVVVYADTGPVREAVMDYLTGRSTAPPPESQAVVIDIKSLDQLQFGEVLSGQRAETTPFRLPGLEAWAKGEVVKITEKAKIPVGGRGRPVFGLENPKAHDELLYGYGPYAPIGASPAVQATFQKCVSPAFQMSITPHSPVTVEVRDAQGQETGLSRAGAATDAIPGSLVSHSGRTLKLVSLPAGTYTVKLTGTGAGPATLVLAVPTAGGISTQVFHFRSRAGASGTLRVSAAGASTRMDFGGRAVRAAAGLALSVHGLPASLRHGRTAHLSLAIGELLGHGAPSVAVRVSGAAGSLHSSSRLSGRLRLTLDPRRRGSIRLQFSGPGYQSLTRTIRVR